MALTPVVALVQPDAALVDDLKRRFSSDYDIVASPDPVMGLAQLAQTTAPVALVMVPMWMDDMTGIDFLVRARELQPGAKRIIVIAVGDVSARPEIRRALTLNQIDFFVGMPWDSPEEELFPVVGEALRLWARDHQLRYDKAVIIDRDDLGRGREIHARLGRNSVWTRLVTADSPEGSALLERHGLVTDRLPVLVLWDGRVLVDPAQDEIAEAMGARTHPEPGVHDLVVVGAGPAGLAAAAYAASEGLRVTCIESDTIGGQAATTSKIRNYLGFRWGISGLEFGERAGRHAEDLGADYVISRTATGLRSEGTDRIVTLDNGEEIVARAVVVAGGVAYRRLDIREVDRLVGSGVFYGAGASEAQSMGGLDVFVLGGGNSAGQAATHLASAGARVTMLIRGASLGPPMSDYLIKEIEATAGVRVRTSTQVVGAETEQHLERLVLLDTKSGETETVNANALLIFIGARPHTEWLQGTLALDDNGFVVTGRDLSPDAWELARPPAFLETSMPGVFAAGDIRRHSVKRVAAAVGEGSTATLLVRDHLAPPKLNYR